MFETQRIIDYALIWKIVIIFSLILLSIIAWNRWLRGQITLHSNQLAHSFSHDQLTELPNRNLMADRLTQFIQESQFKKTKVALLSLDIDDFKKVNDVYGHQIGDLLIQAFSSSIQQSLPENSIGRLGADQFLIIHGHFHDVSDVALLARKILISINRNYTIEAHDIALSTSLGIALYPDDGSTAHALLRHADTATHYAKKHFPGSYAFYTPELNQEAARKLNLERCLASALSQDEFDVHFQPKVNAQTRRIVSFEALLRWTNKEIGSISPAEFIPVAEKIGLINDIGNFVLDQAISALSLIQKRYGKTFSMAINLSPIQFSSGSLLAETEALLSKNELDGKTIEFEITEGILLTQHINVQQKMTSLESLGISFAMDDFGTGYSSLSYLRKYKFNTLKIDREFITDLPSNESSRKLVAATIAMAHELSLKVVAEGVETEQQSIILIEQNCDLLQGSLFSRAIPLEKLMTLLDQQNNIDTLISPV